MVVLGSGRMFISLSNLRIVHRSEVKHSDARGASAQPTV